MGKCQMPYANNKGADQPAHPRSLISAFVIRCLASIVPILAKSKISRLQLASVAEQAGLSYLVANPKNTFSHDMAQLWYSQQHSCQPIKYTSRVLCTCELPWYAVKLNRRPWATMPTWVNCYKSLIQHFRLSVAMATNQNEEFVQLLCYSTIFIKTFCQNTCTCSEIAINTYFHFSHYKSMETCHSNESTWAMAIKNISFVETTVMNISAKFQLHAPYRFWLFNVVSQIYPFGCHGNQSNLTA